MSWVVNEWKEGLPHRALQKIEEIEGQLDRVKKERQQKQFQLDSLEQALEKQKRKTEDEKTALTEMKRDHQILAETCEQLQQKYEKLEHEIQTKEGRMACLEGQLEHSKQSLDSETNKGVHLKGDLEKVQQDHLEMTRKMEHLQGEFQRLQEHSRQMRHQLDTANDKLRDTQNEVRFLQGQLDGQGNSGRIGRHISGGNNELSTLRQKLADLEALREKEKVEKKKLEDELKSLQDKVTRDLSSSNKKLEDLEAEKQQLTNNVENNQLAVSASQSHTQREIVENQGIMDIQLKQLEQMVDKYKKECEGLKTKNANLELCVQTQEKAVAEEKACLKELQGDLDSSHATLSEKDKKLGELQDQSKKTNSQLEESNQKIVQCEERLKKLGLELECQRHNAEAARAAQEQRAKDRDREQKAEAASQADSIRDMQRQLTETANKLSQEQNKAQQERNHLKGQLERAEHKCHQVEKELKETQQKFNTAEHTVKTFDETKTKIQASIDQSNKEKEHMSVELERKSSEILRLEGEVSRMKAEHAREEQVNNDIRGKMLDKELEVESLQAQIERTATEHINEVNRLKAQIEEMAQPLKERDDKCAAVSGQLVEFEARVQQEKDGRGAVEVQMGQECDGLKTKLDLLQMDLEDKDDTIEMAQTKFKIISEVHDYSAPQSGFGVYAMPPAPGKATLLRMYEEDDRIRSKLLMNQFLILRNVSSSENEHGRMVKLTKKTQAFQCPVFNINHDAMVEFIHLAAISVADASVSPQKKKVSVRGKIVKVEPILSAKTPRRKVTMVDPSTGAGIVVKLCRGKAGEIKEDDVEKVVLVENVKVGMFNEDPELNSTELTNVTFEGLPDINETINVVGMDIQGETVIFLDDEDKVYETNMTVLQENKIVPENLMAVLPRKLKISASQGDQITINSMSVLDEAKQE